MKTERAKGRKKRKKSRRETRRGRDRDGKRRGERARGRGTQTRGRQDSERQRDSERERQGGRDGDGQRRRRREFEKQVKRQEGWGKWSGGEDHGGRRDRESWRGTSWDPRRGPTHHAAREAPAAERTLRSGTALLAPRRRTRQVSAGSAIPVTACKGRREAGKVRGLGGRGGC